MNTTVLKFLFAALIFVALGIYHLYLGIPDQPSDGFRRDISWLTGLFSDSNQGWGHVIAAGVSIVLAYVFWWLDKNKQ
jgi:hypothetical protein